jgi:ATP-dependent RNA helicase DDX54/DBP10
MLPSRELAIQTLKVVKEMGKGTDLRTVLLVGGDSLEEQFASVMQNPDMYLPYNFLSLIEASLPRQAVSCI